VELPALGSPPAWRRQAILLLLLTGLYLVLVVLDRPVFKALFVGLERIDRLEEADGYRLFRVLGSLWSWGGIALVIFAHDWGRVGRVPALSLRRPPASWRFGSLSRGLMVFGAPVLAGLFAEGAKRLIGRLRPIETDGFYVYAGAFDAMLDPPNGMASSHCAVAVGGAVVVMAFFPKSGWILIPGAIGCAVTRLVSGAHFLTDVYLGAVLGYLAGVIVLGIGMPRSTPPAARA
jgi:membrane-associated phospholipid phosphatase